MVEHLLAKENVESSNLFIRSLKSLSSTGFLKPWDIPKISVCIYWLVRNIDTALESALITIAISKRDSWEWLLTKLVQVLLEKVIFYGIYAYIF